MLTKEKQIHIYISWIRVHNIIISLTRCLCLHDRKNVFKIYTYIYIHKHRH